MTKILHKKFIVFIVLMIVFVFMLNTNISFARKISFGLHDGLIGTLLEGEDDNQENDYPPENNDPENDDKPEDNDEEEIPPTDEENNNDTTNKEQIIENGAYTIVCAGNEKYVLDVSGPSTDNGAKLHIWQKTDAPNQKFYITYEGDGYYKIASVNSAKVIDVEVASTESLANIQQYENNDTDAQRFKIIKNDDGTYTFIAKCSGMAIDIANGVYENGNAIRQYEVNETDAQKFKLEKTELINDKVNNGIISIKSAANPTMQLDVINCSAEEGNKLHLWKKAPTLAQRFEMHRVGENEVRIRTAASGGWLKESNNNVVQSGNSKTKATNSDTWKVEWDNGIILINKESGMALTINGDMNANGTAIKVKERSNVDAQRLLINTEYIVPDGYFTIQSKYGTMLNMKDYNQGTPLQTANATGTARQVFEFHITESGYKISSPASGWILDVQSGSKLNAATVQMEIDAGTKSQRWTPILQDGGYVNFKNVNSGLMLNVHLFNQQPGAEINQGLEDHSDAQLWKLTPATFDEFSRAWGDYATDKAYLATVIDRADRVGSDTDWFIAIDVRAFRLTLLNRVNGKWYVDACFNATMGYLGSNGLSHTGLGDQNGKTETNWTVTRKIPNRSGDLWFVSYIDYTRPDGSDYSQGIHNHYELAGQSYSSHGCPRLTDANAKYLYDTVAIGSRVHIWQ